MKRPGAAIALVLACGLQAAAMAAEAPVWWRTPAAPEIAWRGMLATEGGAVGMGTQIGPYPAFGVAGLLVAVFTHAAISQGVQSAERKRAQEDADRVLEPYAAALKAWPARTLWDAAVAAGSPGLTLKLWESPAAPADGPLVEVLPVYTLAQDEGVLVLDAAIKLVTAPGAAPAESMIRVVSSPHEAADARAHWSADEARQLKATAAAMLAHALQTAADAARREAAPPASDAAPMRTHRYLQGSVERSERAQWVGGDCARAVLRNLRGWLLSVPLRPAEGSPCARTHPF